MHCPYVTNQPWAMPAAMMIITIPPTVQIANMLNNRQQQFSFSHESVDESDSCLLTCLEIRNGLVLLNWRATIAALVGACAGDASTV